MIPATLKYFAIMAASLASVCALLAGLYHLMVVVSERTGSPEFALAAAIVPVLVLAAMFLALLDERT